MSLTDCENQRISILYMVLMLTFISLSSVGFVLNAALFFSLIKSKFLPKNVTFLIGNLTLALLLNVLPAMNRNVYYVKTLTTGYLVQLSQHFCTQIVFRTINGFVVIVSMGSLGLERWMVTRKLEKKNFMENKPSDKRSIVVIVLISGIWIFAAISGATTTNTSVYENPPTQDYPFDGNWLNSSNSKNLTPPTGLYWCACPRMKPGAIKARLLPAISMYMMIEIAIICMYVNIWRVNKRKLEEFDINTQSHSLENRFEMRQNIRTTLMMLPTVLAHGFCMFGVISVAYLQMLLFDGEKNELYRNIVVLIRQIFFELYDILHPIFIFISCKQLRATLFSGKTSELDTAPHSSQVQPQGVKVRSRNLHTKGVDNKPVEFRMNPEAGVEIVEKIWGQKCRPTVGRQKAKQNLSDEPLVEIDQVWEDGMPKRHKRPTKRLSLEPTTTVGLSSFIAKFKNGEDEQKKERKYEIRTAMPDVEID